MFKYTKLGLGMKFMLVMSTTILSMMAVLLVIQLWVYNGNNSKNIATVQHFFNNEVEDKKLLLKDNLKDRGLTILNFMAQIGVDHMGVFDYDSLNHMVREIENNKEVVTAVYYDNDGKAVTTEKSVNEGNLIELTSALVDSSSGEKIGELTLWMTTRFTDEIIQITEDKMSRNVDELDKGFSDQTRNMTSLSVLVSVGAVFFANVILFVLVKLSLNRPLSRSIHRLTDTSGKLAGISDHLSESSRSLAVGSSEQAASIEETSSSLEEMASMTRQNADNADVAKTKMLEVSRIVQKVNEHMGDMAGAIREITQSSEETGKIIKSIDEIAFQTNLLALNAAVEAARAGEAGAGFAVVADEVRNLAMKAADAAKTTTELIETTIKSVQKGSELTHSTGEAFQENIAISEKVGELVEEIAAASSEQAQGIEEVNRAVAEMDKVVQQVAATAEESAAASEEMKSQAVELESMVGGLNSIVSGNGLQLESRKTGQGLAMAALASNQEDPALNQTNAEYTQQKSSLEWEAEEVNPRQVIPMQDEDFKDF